MYPAGQGRVGVGVPVLVPAGVVGDAPEDEALGVGVADFRTATLRLEMVALDTPASLASQL